eukprot:6204357-Pleurochrysis_carterae.AAC.2
MHVCCQSITVIETSSDTSYNDIGMPRSYPSPSGATAAGRQRRRRRRRHAAAVAGRPLPRLHRRVAPRHHQLARVHQWQLGCPLLASS